MAQALSTGETVRAEEIVLSVPRRPVDHRPSQRHADALGGGRRCGDGGRDPTGHDVPE